MGHWIAPLRTGRADFPHPAYQLVVCSVTETGDFEILGIKQAEEPKFREVAVGPALMVGATTAAFATATFSQYASPTSFNCTSRTAGFVLVGDAGHAFGE